VGLPWLKNAVDVAQAMEAGDGAGGLAQAGLLAPTIVIPSEAARTPNAVTARANR
jgi:hypothetical protein